MLMIGYVAIFLILLAFPVIGIFMIYSAITGKGIEPPGEDELLQIRAQYHLRGIIGFGLLIVGGVVLWKFIVHF